MTEDGARSDEWALNEQWAEGVSWEVRSETKAGTDVDPERLKKLARLVERTRARIETLCVLGDLVGEKTAAAVSEGVAAPALEEIEQMVARLSQQFSHSAEECEGQLLAFASDVADQGEGAPDA